MKNLYKQYGKAALLLPAMAAAMLITHAQTTPDYSNANYTPQNMGKIVPNNNTTYIDNRQKTRFVYDQPSFEDRLPQPVRFTSLYASPGTNGVELTWRTDWEPDNLKLYEIEFSKDGISFQRVGVIAAGNYLNGKAYTYKHFPVNERDRIFYRLRMVDENGRYAYTDVIPIRATGTTGNYVFPTVVNTGVVSLYLNDTFRTVQVVNMEGRVLQAQLLDGRTGRVDIPLIRAATGICFVRVVGNDMQKNIVQKIFIR